MKNAIIIVHGILREHVKQGDIVIDATVGNGHDTELLAALVGEHGYVYGFDVQQQAIDAAESRLNSSSATIRLFLAGHETITDMVDPQHKGLIKAVTFNLGYLPGGDKAVTTTAETTLAGIKQALDVLRIDGIITIVCYHHPEGERELAVVRDLLTDLPQTKYTSLETNFINQRGNPAVVFVVQARS